MAGAKAGDSQAQFEAMVASLHSPDNVLRGRAEQAYEDLKKNNPQWLIMALVEVGCTSTNIENAQLGLVLLRKNFGDLFQVLGQLTSDQQEHVKASLLNRFGDANTPHLVRKACASSVAKLATILSSENRNAWPNLWELLLTTAGEQNAQPQLRAMCLEVFSQVASFLVSTYFAPKLPDFVVALNRCLGHDSAPLRSKALEVVSEFVHTCTEEQMPVMRQTSVAAVQAYRMTVAAQNSEEALEQAKHIRAVVDESDHTLFENNYRELLEALFDCASNQRMERDARHMALGALFCLGESEPGLFKRSPDFVTKLFNLLFQYMLHIEMEDEWENTYEKEEDEEKRNDCDAGAQGADRLSHIVRGKIMEQLAAPTIMQNCNHDNWRNRAAALTLLTYVFEGAIKNFRPHIKMVMEQVVLPHINDGHPYVRYCAIQCIAQFSSDLCPEWQRDWIAAAIPLICEKLGNDCPRIMCLAACTINTIFDELDNEKDEELEEREKSLPENQRYRETRYLDPLFPPLMQALFATMRQNRPVFVHSETLAAMSSVVQVAEARVRPFTRDIVTCCEHFLSFQGNDNDAMLIRCRAIEVTTLTASYVGKESFADYSKLVCNYLLNVLNSGLAQEDVRLRYVLRGWTCMVECLGTDVLEYLGQVMNPLLALANSNCDGEIIEKDIGEEFKDTEKVKHVRITLPGKGECVMRMHTSLIEDKDLALTIVLNFTEMLKGAMYPYMHDLTNTALAQLKFMALAETRESASMLLQAILTVVKEREPNSVDNYIRHITPKLLEAIDDEAEQSTVQVMLGTLSGVWSKASVGILDENLANDAARMMHEIYTLSIDEIERLQQLRADKLREHDEDEAEDAEANEADEADLLQDCATSIGQLLRIVPGFHRTFEHQFLPMTTQLLNPALQDTQHEVAIHLLCEFIEFGGEAVVPHLQNANATFRQYAVSQNPDVAQAAFYGLNMCVSAASNMQRNDAVNNFVRETAALAGQFLGARQAREEEWLGVTTNVISIAFRILVSFNDLVDQAQVFAVCMRHFPLADDDETEKTRIHDRLVQWLANPQHPLVGVNSQFRAPILNELRNTPYLSDDARRALADVR